MSNFFYYVNRKDYDQIYNSLSPEHILIFVLFVLGFIGLIRLSKRQRNLRLLKRLEKISLSVMAAGQITYFIWFSYFQQGGDKWPLYACRIACILLFFTYFVHWMPLEEYSIYTALYGGISSVFWSTPKPFAFPHVTRIAFFATHIGLAYSALLRILLHDEEIDRRSLKAAQKVNFAMIGIVLVLDIIFDWNYMFLMTPQLPTGYLQGSGSLPAQIAATVFVVFVYVFAVFAAWVFAVFLQVYFSPKHWKEQDMRPSVRQSSKPEFIRRLTGRVKEIEKEKKEQGDKP